MLNLWQSVTQTRANKNSARHEEKDRGMKSKEKKAVNVICVGTCVILKFRHIGMLGYYLDIITPSVRAIIGDGAFALIDRVHCTIRRAGDERVGLSPM